MERWRTCKERPLGRDDLPLFRTRVADRGHSTLAAVAVNWSGHLAVLVRDIQMVPSSCATHDVKLAT